METAYLLIWGELPTQDQLVAFEHEVQMHRRVSFRVRDMLKCFPASGHPMDALQSSAAALGLFHSRRAIDDPNYIYKAVVRLIAKIPTMVAAFQLIRKGQDPIHLVMIWPTPTIFSTCSPSERIPWRRGSLIAV